MQNLLKAAWFLCLVIGWFWIFVPFDRRKIVLHDLSSFLSLTKLHGY